MGIICLTNFSWVEVIRLFSIFLNLFNLINNLKQNISDDKNNVIDNIFNIVPVNIICIVSCFKNKKT